MAAADDSQVAQRFQLDPDAPEPLHEQIAASLRQRIASGELSGRLPGLADLAESYGVSKPTVQKAQDVLKKAGLVRGVAGRGVFVVRQGQ